MSDPEVNVLHVGDGACTVLRPWAENRPGPVVILDCGVRRGSPRGAAQTLLGWLEGTLSQAQAVVVSHFDWDHWGGLANLATLANHPVDLPAIPLYYPAMPRQVPAAFMAMMGPLSGTGSAVLDLQLALGKVSANSTLPALRPLNNRSAPVLLAGERFHALWPPSQISPNELRGINTAVTAVTSLADDLAAAGHGELKERLARANRAALELPGRLDMDSQGKGRLAVASRQGRENDDVPDLNADDWVPDAARSMLDTIPTQWHERYKRTLTKIRAANNNLSLVLAAESGRLIAFGDIGGVALTTVLRNHSAPVHGTLPDRYDVLLAPHHGTHTYPTGMPTANWCVAQGGADHYPAWVANHPHEKPDDLKGQTDSSTRHANRCWHTQRDGNFSPR